MDDVGIDKRKKSFSFKLKLDKDRLAAKNKEEIKKVRNTIYDEISKL